MNLIQKRRLERLEKLNKQNDAQKAGAKGGNAKAAEKPVSKLRQNMKAKAEKAAAQAAAQEAVEVPKDETNDGVQGKEPEAQDDEDKASADQQADKSNKDDELQDDVESQGDKVDELSDDVDGLKSDVGDLEDRMDDAEYEIQALKDKLDDDTDYVGNPELETQKQVLAGCIDEMKDVDDIEDRKSYKAEAVTKLIDFVNGYVASAANYPNIVAVWVMIWLFDLGDIARALTLGLHLAAQKIQKMPVRFHSDIQTFICDQMYDWAKAELEAGKSSGPYLENLINTIESDKWKLSDVVHGKMYAIYGKHLDALGEDEAALKAYETAMGLNSRAGVKKRMQVLEAKLAKAAKA